MARTSGSLKYESGEMLAELGACRDVEQFEKLARIGEGTYGTVYRARDRRDGRVVALKRVLLHNEASDGFPITALREIKLLKRLRHPNCVRLLDVAVGRKRSSVFLVFEYCEHDLSLLLRHHSGARSPFKESEVKRIVLSVLHALEHLHTQNLLHRDIKLSNILYDRYGVVKLADFGLARERSCLVDADGAENDDDAGGENDAGDAGADEPLTPKVVTLWYRAPELLLGCTTYSAAVDMWACGCIFGELLLQEPLMPGKTETEQLEKIFRLLGRATDQIWPGMSSLPNASALAFDTSQYTYNNVRRVLPDLSDKGVDLINRLLMYDPAVRITAREAIEHPYFREKPFPQEASMMPTFPSLHPGMKDAAPKSAHDSHRQQQRNRDSMRFGEAFGGGSQAPSTSAGIASALKKRRV